MKESVLITGGTGYLGRVLTNFYLSRGHEVHIIVRDVHAAKMVFTSSPLLHIYPYDGTYLSLSPLKKIKNISVCMHIAALAAYDVPAEALDSMIDANLRLGIHLLEILKEVGCRRMINTGTYWQHLFDGVYNPVCLYAATKQAFEAIIEYYVQSNNFKVITLKLFDVYGPSDHRKKLFWLLSESIQAKKTLAMTEGNQLLDMVYIEDVIAAFDLAYTKLNSDDLDGFHQDYFVGSGKLHTLRQIVELYLQLSNNQLDVQWGKLPYRDRQIMKPYHGPTLSGWIPKVSLEEGIRSIVSQCKMEKI